MIPALQYISRRKMSTTQLPHLPDVERLSGSVIRVLGGNSGKVSAVVFLLVLEGGNSGVMREEDADFGGIGSSSRYKVWDSLSLC